MPNDNVIAEKSPEDSGALEQLRRRERELADFIENAPVGLHWVGADGTILWANQAELDLLGYIRDEYIGRHIAEFHVDADVISDILMRLTKNETLHNYEAGLRCKDGSIRYVLISSNVRRENGEFIHTRCFTRDITERKSSEDALRDNEEQFRAVAETAPDAIFTIDEASTIVFVNQSAERIFGYIAEELLGQPLTMLMPEYLRHLHRGGLERYIETGQKHIGWEGVELPGLHKDGREIPLEISFSEFTSKGKRHFTGIARDITDRKQAEEALRESERQLHTLADAVPQLVWMAEPDGHIFWYNRRWYDYTGTTPEQMQGWGWQLVHDPEMLPQVVKRWRASLETGEPFEMQFPLKGSDGVFRWFLTRVNPLRDSQGRIVRWFGTNTDVDEQRRTAEELREANRLKDEFLAIVSHELRTPLTAILGWAHLLRAGQMNEKSATHALETIERNAHAQSQLIDDLLDVSRIITGKLRLDVRQVEPTSFIEPAIEALSPAAEAKGVRVQKVMDTGVSSVAGDPARLQQVIWNLLSNAIKFTPRGGRVQVRLERINSHIEIAVSDTGTGIKPEFLPHVFERFRQADQKTTRQHGGLGLGLAIVRHLVELHGGTVEAKSLGEGQGATFIVKLPTVSVYQKDKLSERVHPAARDNLPSFGCPERMDGMRVLVVDDEADTRELLKVGLSQCGAAVTSVASAQEALEAIEKERPAILVSDIGMPGEDGYELIRKVRALSAKRGGKIPAIALTAYARTEDRLRVLRAGYQMHVSKPVELTELVAVMASLIQRTEEVK